MSKGTPLYRKEQYISILFFMDTQCPCVNSYLSRISALQERYKKYGVRLFYIFPSSNKPEKYILEYTRRNKIDENIIVDKKNYLLRKFKITVTAQVVILDENSIVRYNGRIDDNIFRPHMVKQRSLEQALLDVIFRKPSLAIGILPDSCRFVSE